jgi:hypothetical protein
MERDKALHILKALADGIDPASGAAFDPGSPYQHADTVRALYWALQRMDERAHVDAADRAPQPAAAAARPAAAEQPVADAPAAAAGEAALSASIAADAAPAAAKPAKQAKPRDGARSNAGRPWSADEEAQLAAAFDRGCTLEVLAQVHQRSRFAIEARLAKLGKIPAPASGLRFPIRPPTASQPRAGYSAAR